VNVLVTVIVVMSGASILRNAVAIVATGDATALAAAAV